MAKFKLFHNPRCRKSREALELLQKKKVDFEVVEYLETPPSSSELKNILKKLEVQAEAIIRKTEDIFKLKFKNKSLSNEEWIRVLSKNPKLIERPILIGDKKAVVGRPPEKILEII